MMRLKIKITIQIKSVNRQTIMAKPMSRKGNSTNPQEINIEEPEVLG